MAVVLVPAILQAVATATVPSVTTATVTPFPAPLSMIGAAPTVSTFNIVTDLTNSKVQFSYLVYQTYNAAGGATGLASSTGTTAAVSIPGVSKDLPAIVVTVVPTSVISGSSVVFTLTASIAYNQVTPGKYDVDTGS